MYNGILTRDQIEQIVTTGEPRFLEERVPAGHKLLVPFIYYKTAKELHGDDMVISTVYLAPGNLHGVGDTSRCYLVEDAILA